MLSQILRIPAKCCPPDAAVESCLLELQLETNVKVSHTYDASSVKQF